MLIWYCIIIFCLHYIFYYYYHNLPDVLHMHENVGLGQSGIRRVDLPEKMFAIQDQQLQHSVMMQPVNIANALYW